MALLSVIAFPEIEMVWRFEGLVNPFSNLEEERETGIRFGSEERMIIKQTDSRDEPLDGWSFRSAQRPSEIDNI